MQYFHVLVIFPALFFPGDGGELHFLHGRPWGSDSGRSTVSAYGHSLVSSPGFTYGLSAVLQTSSF